MTRLLTFAALCLAVLLAAPARAAEPDMTALYNPDLAQPVTEYRIGPLDRLNITVFQVKDLTMEKVQVDAGGQILLPLIGSVKAQGKTTSELSNEVAKRLSEKYLQSPQVSIVVEEAVSQKITVQGAVNEAGVFMMRGRTSLLEAVAMAKGPNKQADLKKVAVVRSVNGQPHAAMFNLAAIRAGKERNPEVLANDVIVVDTSRGAVAWDNILKVLPSLVALTYF